MNSKLNRIVFGSIIGLMAGISFGFTVLPLVAGQTVPESLTPELYTILARYLLPAALLWIPGGVMAALRGEMAQGAKFMGIGGAIVGVIYAAVASGGTDIMLMLVSGLGAALYGAGAGLLVGGGFPAVDPKID